MAKQPIKKIPNMSEIPVGDIRFYDNFVPSLEAGNWWIHIDQSIDHSGNPLNVDSNGNVIPLTSKQEFVVSAPQFSIIPSEIINRYPPLGSTGRYGEVLPHIVFSDPLLPWEREMKGGGKHQPWLALLIFSEDELIYPTGTHSPTRSIATTVKDFMGSTVSGFKPTITKEDDVKDSDPCSYIQISTDVFKEITPRLKELRYLSHTRQINTGDKAVLGLNEHGLFSVVVANRFPAQPTNADGLPVKSFAHLVSVEGFESVLVDSPDFKSNDHVSILSLASWTFQTQADRKEDFRGLWNSIVNTELDGTTYTASNLWLRIPSKGVTPSTNAGKEIAKRLNDGFVPLNYQTRTSEQTFSWYRGPLTPLLTTEITKTVPFPTGDAAIIYDKTNGVFDMSLASAWQIGRSVALADKSFGKMLLDLRRKAHRITDHLLHRLQSDHFTVSDIDSLIHDSQVQDEFISLLDKQLLQDVGTGTTSNTNVSGNAGGNGDTDPKTAVKNFLAQPKVQAKLIELVVTDLDPIATWLSKLLLLYQIPFNYLVPDERMLPTESLRFFYLDNNWLGALLDGALSIGMQSSRDTFFYEITHGLLHEAAFEAQKIYRENLQGVAPSPTQVNENLVSGFLLRSALVSGWPNLAVRPYQNGSDDKLKILRMDHLSPTVLFCLVEGVPDYFELSEPQEGFRFGVDDDWKIMLRNMVPPKASGDPLLGSPLSGDLFPKTPATVKDFLRSESGRVLTLTPDSTSGLVQKLTTANPTAAAANIKVLSPGEFALQMVKSPEAIQFKTQL